MAIEKVAVIGSGVMGSGIAAQVANAGFPVVLLDIVPKGAEEGDHAARNAIAAGSLKKLQKARPPALMHRRFTRNIEIGNLEDDLNKLKDCDWIIEVIIERLDIKQSLYKKLEAVTKPGAIVSSNTSTIPLKDLTEQASDEMKSHFAITHFFNPPRYMRLLELVQGEHTKDSVMQTLENFCDRALGKGVVHCKDTPGFIGNRIGVYWLQCALSEAFAMGISVEEADAVLGRPLGIPKTGAFGLLDLIGLDLMPHILKSMLDSLPPEDPMLCYKDVPALVSRMIEDGYTGRKGKGGFYSLSKEGGKRVKMALDLTSGDYEKASRPSLECVRVGKEQGLAAMMSHDSKVSQYAAKVMAQTLVYAAQLVPEIADELASVDEAMRLGYNWQYGPFEMIDRIGVDWLVEYLQNANMSVPPLLSEAAAKKGFYEQGSEGRSYLVTNGPAKSSYKVEQRAPGVILLKDIKRSARKLAKRATATLWDLGDGVAGLEFHSKLNAIDGDMLDLVYEATEVVPKNHKALVVYNEGEHFSAGANLGMMSFIANIAAWEQIHGIVRKGQHAYRALRFANFPVVAAPSGMALGGGCEILLHSDAVVAHAELYTGLVEVGVGLIPAWGGCKILLERGFKNKRLPKGPMPSVIQAFETISVAKVSGSAFEAKDMHILRHDDEVVMNRNRVLAAAKEKALSMVEGYQPPEPYEFRLPGPSGKAAMELALQGFKSQGKVTPHDLVVADALTTVLSGGDTDVTETISDEGLYDLEFEHFIRLAQTPGSLARIEHMLETGKPLRN